MFFSDIKKILSSLAKINKTMKGYTFHQSINDISKYCLHLSNLYKMQQYDEIRKNISIKTPDNPAARSWKAYSQTDEDGIISECLKRIATKTSLSKTCIEFCCGDGRQNNTYLLLLQGFTAVWLDGNEARMNRLKTGLGGLQFKNLLVMNSFVTLGNIDSLCHSAKEFLPAGDIDFFSLDMDGNDIYFVEKIASSIAPKLFCVEYNAKFPPPISISIAYNPEHTWGKDDYFGASLQKFVDVLTDYTLVSCGVSGVNAFFVRNDFSSLFTKYSPEELYQRQRAELIFKDGRSPNYKWLKQVLVPKNDGMEA